jgi:hypothetical protein
MNREFLFLRGLDRFEKVEHHLVEYLRNLKVSQKLSFLLGLYT